MKLLPIRLLDQPKLSRFIWETFLRNKKWAFTVIFLRCAALSEKIFWPLFIKLMTDELITARHSHHMDWERIILIMIVGFGAWLNGEVAEATSNIVSGRKIAAMRAGARLFVLDSLYKQSQQYFNNRFAGSISTNLRDISESVSDILNDILSQFIPAIIIFCCLSFIFFKLYIGYTLMLLAWMAMQITLVYFTKRKAQQKSRSYGDYRSELFGKLIDSMGNHLSISSFAAHQSEYNYISATEKELINKRSDVVNYTQYVYLCAGFLEFVFVVFGFMGIYLYLFQQGRATPGDMMFMVQGIYGVMSIVRQISNRTFQLYEQIGIGQDAIRKILVPHSIADAPNAKALQITKAELQIENLSFSYLVEKPVLQSVDITMHSGEKIGLVGYSGAGKTTLINLLLRFYEATGGRILIDGQDIREVTQESLRRAIALIPQDTSLFHRSLRDNILIARPDANDDDIIAASKLAGAHDFIMNQAHGYDTLVGERGVKLSGGQRQRVAIARAFLKAAPILILDEATSALDSVTEKSIQDALDKVMAGRTTIVIAHRLSTLRRMDRILVFDHGRIVEQGSHEALLALNGRYAQMWALQAGGFLPEKDPVALSQADELP